MHSLLAKSIRAFKHILEDSKQGVKLKLLWHAAKTKKILKGFFHEFYWKQPLQINKVCTYFLKAAFSCRSNCFIPNM